jgi:translocation and assembly module TamB
VPPRRGLRRAGLALALVLLTLVVSLGGGWWLWHSETGWGRVLTQVPGLHITGQQGRPTGGPFAAQRLEWQGAGLHVIVHDLAWDDARWQWRPGPQTWLGVSLQRPRAARVQVLTQPATTPSAPLAPPTSLRLPIALQAEGLRIGAIEVDAQAPITRFSADLHLGAEAGSQHRLEALAFSREGLDLKGQLKLGSDADLPLLAEMVLASAPGADPVWQAEVRARGPLQRLDLDVRLQHGSGAATSAQATLAPFAAWPLLALEARVDGLDLSVLSTALPGTRLTGHARLVEPARGVADGAELSLDVDLTNLEPGAWDAGRLPLRQLRLLLKGRPSEPGTLVFERLHALLAGTRSAGEVRGEGRWHDGRLALQLTLDGLEPQRLDTRLAAMTVGGQLTITIDGLHPAGSAQAAGAPARRGDLQAAITARLPRKDAPSLGLQLDAGLEAPVDGSLRLALRQAQAQVLKGSGSGDAGTATATASAERTPSGAWTLQTRGQLLRFDPAPWWSAAASGRQPQGLNGSWQADLSLPAQAGVDVLTALRGTARLTLDDSRWAGLDWRGRAEVQAGDRALQGSAELKAGPNRLSAQGRLAHDRSIEPAGQLDLQAPDLAALAPLRTLVEGLPGAADWWPSRGSVVAQARVLGRWPALRSEGQLSVQDLRSNKVGVDRADGRWDLSTVQADAPLSLQLEAVNVSSGAQRLDRLEATLEGSLAAHSVQLRASSPLRPPAWAGVPAGGAAPGSAGSDMLLQGSGRWMPARGGVANGGTWQGNLAELRAAPRSAPDQPWLSAADVQARVTLGAHGEPVQASLAPGRLVAFGGALAWQQASWQAGAGTGAAPQLQLRARLEPLQLAPLLARWQPQFGWRGDLALKGTIDVRSGERFDADVVIERASGDLNLTVDGVTRALALTDLRLGLAAHDGRWHFTQALAGPGIGVLGGLQTVQTTARAVWPDDASPLGGGISLAVPQLSAWSPWLPPGWRLGGALRVDATFGGRFSAPEYRGTVVGDGLGVHNLFEGIRLTQGELTLALTGTQATIQRLQFRDGAGEGVLRVTGGADFGEAPRAQLRAVTERLRLLDRYDRRLTISGTSDIDLRTDRLSLRGSSTIDEGLIDATQADSPSLDSDVLVVNRAPLVAAGPGAAAVPPPSAPARAPTAGPLAQADVDLRIDLGQALRLRGRGLDTLLRGQLRISTPGGRLAVNGVVRAEQGTYAAYGQNLRIERGRVTFRGDVGSPQLDILALRPDIDTRVGVVVSGSAGNPRIRLYSDPDLGEMDTLTWLVLGRAPTGLGRDDTALLQRAALALLAGEGGGNTSLLKQLGLDELSVSRGGGSGASDTIISLGKQISQRLYVGYEHALGAAGGTWQLIYRVAGRLSLRARTGAENAVDAIWSWRWD